MKDLQSEILDELVEKGDGLTVPDGYFERFAAEMGSRLPFREELDVPVSNQVSRRNGTWLRVRPYVYMAAMFAGAWCLIKMFSLMSPAGSDVSLDNYPALSLALEDEQFVDEYVIDCVSPYDIMEDSFYSALGGDETAGETAEDVPSGDILTDNDPQNNNNEYILPTEGDYSTPPYSRE